MTDLNKLKEIDYSDIPIGYKLIILSLIERAEAAEAELARRDAEAGEPDYEMYTGHGWMQISEEYYEGVDKTRGRFRKVFTAAHPAALPDDTRRMDWLCAHCVEVRDPQMYGSHAMFRAQQDSEEWDLPYHTTLREQVDAAMKALGFTVEGE